MLTVLTILLSISLLLIPCSIPLYVGIGLWRLRLISPLGTFASLVTLKPLLTIPLWYYLAASVGKHGELQWGESSISILPEASITLVLVVVFWRPIFERSSQWLWLLLGLDILRWSNSFVLALVWSGFHTPLRQQVGNICAIIGICLPALVALAAIQVVQRTGYPDAELQVR